MNQKQYELTDHLGNVLATISDLKEYDDIEGRFKADVVSCQDYFPGGSLQPGRNWNSGFYRFGLNGQENDNEITGQTGTHTTAMFWEYDTRLMRRWNVDPITYPWHSPYQVFNGNSIVYADPLGLEGTDGPDDPPTDPKQNDVWIHTSGPDDISFIYVYDEKEGWVGQGGVNGTLQEVVITDTRRPSSAPESNGKKYSWLRRAWINTWRAIGNFAESLFGHDRDTQSHGIYFYKKDGGNDNNTVQNPNKTQTDIDMIEASKLLAAVGGVASTKGTVPYSLWKFYLYSWKSFKNGQNWQTICEEVDKMLQSAKKPVLTLPETNGIPDPSPDSTDKPFYGGSYDVSHPEQNVIGIERTSKKTGESKYYHYNK